MLVTVYEDRRRGFPGVQLAVAGLRRYLPWARVRVVRPDLSADERAWLEERPQVEVRADRVEERGWDVKPSLLLAALDDDPDAVWWDSDLLASSDLTSVLPRRPPDALVATEETYWGQEQGNGQRSRAWGLETARLLPTTVNTALLRVSPRHRQLLRAWRDLLRDDRYMAAQRDPWHQRPLHLLGDQEVLTALLESRAFASVPVRLIRRGTGIAQCFGPGGFTAAERLGCLVRGQQPPLVHAMGTKPWHVLPWPEAGTGRGTAGGWRRVVDRLHAVNSPYRFAAASLTDDVGSSPDWLRPPPRWTAVTRGGRGPVGAELPLAVVDGAVRRFRRRVGLGRFRLAGGTDRQTGADAPVGAPFSGRPVLTTLKATSDASWSGRTHWIAPPSDGDRTWALRLAWRARRSSGVVLRGTTGAADHYRDLIAAVAVRLIAPGVPVVVSDATITPPGRGTRSTAFVSGVATLAARALIRSADSSRVTWCVLSRAEVARFPLTWGIRRGRVVFTPFNHTLYRGEKRWDLPTGSHLFSGGNSLRDFDLLASAVEGTGARLVVASSSWSHPGADGIEASAMSHEEFMRAMATSRAVVLALQPAPRSTGQQTYLNAMAFGRPTIVTDSDGVRDHIVDGLTGVVVEPTVEAVRSALLDVLDPGRADHYRRMGERARRVVRRDFTDRVYRARLLELVTDAGRGPVARETGRLEDDRT